MYEFRLGQRKYRVIKLWAGLKSDTPLNNITGISSDQNGKIYILQRDQPYMSILSYDGELLAEWTKSNINDGHYFRISQDERIFIADRNNHRIVILNNSGETLQEIGNSVTQGNLFNHPTDVAFSDNGDIFVSDGYGNACVHRLNHEGGLIYSWGKFGSNVGEFLTPHSILVNQKGHVLVVDRENNRVQIFDQKGNYITGINHIFRPMNIAEDKDGFIYITDQTPTLNLFNPEYEFMGRCLTLGTVGHGVTVDENGDIYIAEMFHDYITKLVRFH